MAGVGVVGGAVLVGGDDVGIVLLVVLGEAVGGGLGRGGLQIVQVAVLLLIVAETLPHVVQHVLGKSLRLGMGQILPQPVGVQSHLVHADQADGGEVVVEGAQIPLGVGIQAGVQQLGDNGALGFQGTGGNVHQLVQSGIEVRLVLRQIGDAGQVDGDHAHGAGGLAGAKEAAGLLPQLAQVKAQAAAHGAHVVGLHIGVNVVGEVGRAVLGGHLEQQLVVLALAPVEVAGDGVGGDGVLEAPAVGVALDHDLDEGLVHHVHFLLAVAIGKLTLPAAHDGGLIRQIAGHRPVQGDIAEGRLGAPAGGGVDAVNEGLDALLDFLLGQVVHLDKGSQIGIEGGERLRARPLVLHDAQEVHHLVAQGAQMAGGGGRDLADHAAQTLLDQLLQAPTGTIAGQHAQIVQVQVGVAVRLGHLGVIDLAEPVVGGDSAGVGQDQTAHGIGNGGVLLHPPVVDLQIVVYQILVVQQSAAHVADLLPLLAVQDIGLGHVGVARLAQHLFHTVLNILNGHQLVLDLRLELRRDPQGQHVHDAGMILLAHGVKGLGNGRADLGDVKFSDSSVSFRHPVHVMILLLSYAAPLRAENKMACSLWGCISKYTTYMGLVKAKNLYLVYKIF